MKNRNCKDRIRYNKIRNLRKKRDEILKCDNTGRIKRLIIDVEDISKLDCIDGWGARGELIIDDGTNFMCCSTLIIDVLKHLFNQYYQYKIQKLLICQK